MNGDWTMYGYKPIEYRESFRRMAGFVRRYTNATAMVWAPNVGTAYPFSPGANLSPPPYNATIARNLTEFLALDTDGSGQFDQNDDPYGPYYPGDDVVDWVGLSLYYYPLQEINEPLPLTYFEDTLTGTGDTIQYIQNMTLLSTQWADQQNFYKRFAEDKQKPMMFPETGAPFLRDLPANAGELNIKRVWWEEMYSLATISRYPLLKLFVNFEETKTLNRHVRDWSITNSTEVTPEYVRYLTSFASNLARGDRFKYGCDGSMELVS
jgi:hypothetical protein